MIALEVLKKKREQNAKEQKLTRSFDRYPQNVTPDFRQLDIDTLKRYVEVYKLECHMGAPRAQLAGVVARHFRGELDATEEEILPNFVEYVLNYNGGNSVKRIKQDTKRQTRQRKRIENGPGERAKKKVGRKERPSSSSRTEARLGVLQDSSSQGSQGQDGGELSDGGGTDNGKKRKVSASEKRGRKPNNSDKPSDLTSSKRGRGSSKPKGRDAKGSGRGGKRKNDAASSRAAKKRRGSNSSRGKSAKSGSKKDSSSVGPSESQDEAGSQAEIDSSKMDEDIEVDDDAESNASSSKTYCICKGPSYGEMIACDNEKCAIEWFHIACVDVGPEKVKKGTDWFCPDCRKKLEAAIASAGNKKAAAGAPQTTTQTAQNGSNLADPQVDTNTEGQNGLWANKPDVPKFAEMIRGAIQKLPNQRGTYAMICKQLESDFGDQLNGSSEAKTPVWKSSVRKVLSQPDRFQKVDDARHMYAVVDN